ncbi:MAG TPA: alcohol dehydrogenase [Desulfobacteraceae bacterium]|nr:alcohol dehydrogenase [Desulfobacteraceae bacterium]
MKAAILLEPNKFEIKETFTPPCPTKGVLVKVKACGICSSDIKMVTKGHRALVYPRILGHEISGVVAESRSKDFKEGDRVQVAPGLRCGLCVQCREGADNQCKHREILGFTRDGGFAEYVAIPLAGRLFGALTLLSANLSYESATFAEPVACCINAQNRVNIKEGDAVMIVGAGTLGLLHSMTARLRGAETILMIEPDTLRRKIAYDFGADRVFDSADENLCQSVMDETDETGVDVIIFACSQAGLNKKFINMLASGGRISIFSGIPSQLSKLILDSNFIHYKEITITGAYGCSAGQNREAIELISSKNLPVADIITCRVSLDNIYKGFEQTSSKESIKSIVEF